MITRENLIEAANRLYENINIEFVNGDNPYWDIQSADPEEIDEDITVAKLYYDTFDLEIKVGTLLTDGIIDLCLVFGEDEDWIREREPEWLLRYIVDTIYDEISECINYNEVLLEYLKSSGERLKIMNRPKYKEMWKDSQNEYAKCKQRLMDCENFIKETKKFVVDRGLSEEFNKILNDKYGMSLANTILSIR